MINALEAENISAGALEGSVILPLEPFVEKKQPPEHDWPSFTSTDGKRIHYGASCCPRTIAVRERYVVVPIDPKYTDQDVNDVIAANRKVYSAVVNA
jgi:hypothetical protein